MHSDPHQALSMIISFYAHGNAVREGEYCVFNPTLEMKKVRPREVE